MGWTDAKNTVSGYVHVAYQIKGNETYNNMLTNSLPLLKTSIPGIGTEDQIIFLSASRHVAYQSRN